MEAIQSSTLFKVDIDEQRKERTPDAAHQHENSSLQTWIRFITPKLKDELRHRNVGVQLADYEDEVLAAKVSQCFYDEVRSLHVQVTTGALDDSGVGEVSWFSVTVCEATRALFNLDLLAMRGCFGRYM